MTLPSSEKLIIERLVEAPLQLVYNAFTQAEHLAHWWGPAGCHLDVLDLSVQAGGRFHYAMTMPDGGKMYGVFLYREVDAPKKLVFTSSFADEQGNPIRAPFSPVFPIKILNTWIFEAQGEKTLLRMEGLPLTETAEEREFFTAMHANMQQGFGATFDQLDRYLASLNR